MKVRSVGRSQAHRTNDGRVFEYAASLFGLCSLKKDRPFVTPKVIEPATSVTAMKAVMFLFENAVFMKQRGFET